MLNLNSGNCEVYYKKDSLEFALLLLNPSSSFPRPVRGMGLLPGFIKKGPQFIHGSQEECL